MRKTKMSKRLQNSKLLFQKGVEYGSYEFGVVDEFGIVSDMFAAGSGFSSNNAAAESWNRDRNLADV